jgi:hypothetical protein
LAIANMTMVLNFEVAYVAMNVLGIGKLKVNQSHYRPEVPRGFQEVKVPRLRDSGPGWW